MSNNYGTKVQWGGDHAPWNQAGVWTIGDRPNQRIVDVQIASADDGNTFNGRVTYSGEGPVGFRAHQVSHGHYQAELQWGGDHAPWNQGGVWVLGDRPNQALIGVHVHSTDNGASLHGSAQYTGEGPIGFQGVHH